MDFLFAPTPVVSLPVRGSDKRFPVHRVYCVGRNYVEHAKEMGFTGREPPFFFLKPTDALVVVDDGQTGTMPYPHVYGYAVGLDMTRRDLQNDMKKQGRPWCIGKAFDHSGPIGPITPLAQVSDIEHAAISLTVNGQPRQASGIDKLIWNIAETIEHLSSAWTLQPGDLIFTGTPEGVAAVVSGDTLVGQIDGLGELKVRID